MTDKDVNRYLLISGQVSDLKRKEFEHTFRLAFSTISNDCLLRSLSIDVNKEGYYHFFSLWPNDRSLKIFMASSEFQIINGVFHALGSVSQMLSGEIRETQQVHVGLS